MRKKVLCAVAVILAATLAAAAGINMQGGLWEIRQQTEVDGKPHGMSTVIIQRCLSRDKPVPDFSNRWQKCTVHETARKGDTVTWAMECATEVGTIKNSGSLTYSGDTFSGAATSDMRGLTGMAGRKDEVRTIRIEGWRLGPCTEQ